MLMIQIKEVACNPKQRVMCPFHLIVSKHAYSQDLINTLRIKMNKLEVCAINFLMWKIFTFTFPNFIKIIIIQQNSIKFMDKKYERKLIREKFVCSIFPL